MADTIKSLQDEIERFRYNADANRNQAEKYRDQADRLDNDPYNDTAHTLSQAEEFIARDFEGRMQQDEQQAQDLDNRLHDLQARAEELRSRISSLNTQHERDLANLESQLSQITGE